MAEFTISTGHKVLIDDDDLERVSKHSWSAFRSKHHNTTYIKTKVRIEGKNHTLFIHRLIAGAPKGVSVDHRNGNGLDNRKDNLRLATKAQNCHNSKRHKDNKSGFKGVYQENGKYRAHITVMYKQIKLGSFKSAEIAARAYDQAARKYYGEFARLNFPEG